MTRGWWPRLADIVAPRCCAGCGPPRPAEPGAGLCRSCARRLGDLAPLAAAPTDRLAPPCAAAGAYEGPLRSALLAYKERGRRDLAGPLAGLLVRLLRRTLPGTGAALLVPVPATARARRARGFDHVRLLCRRAAAALPGFEVAELLRAAPAPDSSGLNLAQRRAAAAHRWRLRPGRVRRTEPERHVIVVDDIVTTGATLGSVSALLAGAGIPVSGAAVVAATLPRLRRDTRKSSRFRW